MLKIEILEPAHVHQVIEHYKICGYNGGIDPNDTLVVARDHNKLIGVMRLCLENHITVLRGMQILPGMQRHKVGTAMLNFCLPLIQDRNIYCLPFRHLEQFYAQIGFQVINGDSLPVLIKNRLLTYRQLGQDVIAMSRPKNPMIANSLNK
jgi:N-acetylglutamate synthase-like GNAT family acetyltransferase